LVARRHRHSPSRCRRINHLALALALLSPEQKTRHGVGQMYRIERSTSGRDLTFFLSGEMDSGPVAELGALMAGESDRLVCLDLAEVTLVTREAMTFLAHVELAGALLVNCPEYVRSWIDAEQGGA